MLQFGLKRTWWGGGGGVWKDVKLITVMTILGKITYDIVISKKIPIPLFNKNWLNLYSVIH